MGRQGMYHKLADVMPRYIRRGYLELGKPKTITQDEIKKLLEEYSLINQKKSLLSANERKVVTEKIKFLFDKGILQVVKNEEKPNEVNNVAPVETGSPQLDSEGPIKPKRGRPAKRIGLIGPATETFPAIEALAEKAAEQTPVEIVKSKPVRKPRKVKEV